jgi:hypothetical protein
LLRKHCFLPMFRHVSQSGQTLGNISEKHRETSNISEFARKHFCFSGSNVSTRGQTGKHLRKHRESQMFPQQCFLVCPGLNNQTKPNQTKPNQTKPKNMEIPCKDNDCILYIIVSSAMEIFMQRRPRVRNVSLTKS